MDGRCMLIKLAKRMERRSNEEGLMPQLHLSGRTLFDDQHGGGEHGACHVEFLREL